MGPPFRSDVRNRFVLVNHANFHGGLTDRAGGSATMAVEVLKSKGVPESHILFLNLIASPQGVKNFAERFPKLRVVTAFIDQGLDEKKWEQHPLNCAELTGV